MSDQARCALLVFVVHLGVSGCSRPPVPKNTLLASFRGVANRAFGTGAVEPARCEVLPAPYRAVAGVVPEQAVACACGDGTYAFAFVFDDQGRPPWRVQSFETIDRFTDTNRYTMVVQHGSLQLERGFDVPVVTIRDVTRCAELPTGPWQLPASAASIWPHWL